MEWVAQESRPPIIKRLIKQLGVGDLRSGGRCNSLQQFDIAMMPSDTTMHDEMHSIQGQQTKSLFPIQKINDHGIPSRFMSTRQLDNFRKFCTCLLALIKYNLKVSLSKLSIRNLRMDFSSSQAKQRLLINFVEQHRRKNLNRH